MLKNRERDPRGPVPPTPTGGRHVIRPSLPTTLSRPIAVQNQKSFLTKPEPDYEVVEFPTEQYVNAKLQPPPPPPPRPPTGHPLDADASCGLCGGGGARVRCTECGRRALCASCDDMYHRHPKRRNHQRMALSSSQLRDERPPLPPKVAPPVPPPRRHKISGDRLSASPRPPSADHRRNTLGHISPAQHTSGPQSQPMISNNHILQQPQQQIPLHLHTKISHTPALNHLGSMPFLSTTMTHTAAPPLQVPHMIHHNTLEHPNAAWARQRTSLQGYDLNPHMVPPPEVWEGAEHTTQPSQGWGRPMQRGASLLELGGGAAACAGCPQCASGPWRYGSCANLDNSWSGGWHSPYAMPPQGPTHDPRMHPHIHRHTSQTPQPYRKADSRAISRAASRAGSRAPSPAMSVRSRTSRRAKHHTPSPPRLPSSDADSESESDSDNKPLNTIQDREREKERTFGPAPPPPNAQWQCEHCTFLNEPGVRVCVVCCRTPTTAPKVVAEVIKQVEKVNIHSNSTIPQQTSEDRHSDSNNKIKIPKSKKECTSTGCGPSPPREQSVPKKTSRLQTPTREQGDSKPNEQLRVRHDMAVGPSPPREVNSVLHNTSTGPSPSRESSKTVKVSPHRDTKERVNESLRLHSVSVGPSPPREDSIVSTSNSTVYRSPVTVQKKCAGTSPPRNEADEKSSTLKAKVSTTGTSPPPQTISTQTYEVPSTWERAPSASRSRPRRRFRDEDRRERSQSRHSLSSDTRESERSVRTVGANGRWEWRERDSSPGAEWGDNYSRLSRRASHLDLRRTRTGRRSGFYGSEAPSPEPQGGNRAASLEALAGNNAQRETERGLELARLMSEAERLGFSAAEVQAALVQSPAAPLAWLRSRWPSLCAGVRAAAQRLAPNATYSELEVRAALARHRGAMWPAVTECVEKHRRQSEALNIGEGRLRGHVWGSPSGADDDAAPPRVSSHRSPRSRDENSSDEFEAPTPSTFREDDWMYLPLDINYKTAHNIDWGNNPMATDTSYDLTLEATEDVARKLKYLLEDAGVPAIDEHLILQSLLSDKTKLVNMNEENGISNNNINTFDLSQSENDFIDAYNALTKTTPLPNIHNNTTLHKANDPNLPKSEISEYFSNTKEIISLPHSFSDKIKQVNNTKKLKSNQESTSLDNTHTATNELDSEVNITSFMEIEATINKSNQATASAIENRSSKKRLKDNTLNENKSTDDRTNNLNDIVDNTQKLIQQMKQEINSDINSLDGQNISQSEVESSSNDEQESSYSDTEERSDTSSNRNGTSSSDESDKSPSFEDIKPHLVARTSSEDNEQFEEAMDHLDGQSNSFKNDNIEILDSIARSLQEEHTISIEYTNPVNISSSKQDVNNNLYTAVNTFEEIYAELNNGKLREADKNMPVTSTRNKQKINNVNPQNLNSDNNQHPTEKIILTKCLAYFTEFKTPNQNKIIINEDKQPISSALLSIMNDKENDKDLKEYIPALERKDNVLDLENQQSISNISPFIIDYGLELSEEITINSSVHEKLYNPQLTKISEVESPIVSNDGQSLQEILSLTNINNVLSTKSINSAVDNSDNQLLNEVTSAHINKESPITYKNVSESINDKNRDSDQTLTISDNSRSKSSSPEDLHEKMTKINEINETFPKKLELVSASEKNINDAQATSNENIQKAEAKTSQASIEEMKLTSTHEQTIEINEENVKVQNENSLNKNIMLKSQIPKFVKSTNNLKSKPDKATPKLVVSKVPIRRTSIKQYPAPTPPKSHFGNIQSGHVKQLQSRLFNTKSPKFVSASLEATAIKPSITTMTKKKAPPPPVPQTPSVSKLQQESPKILQEKKENFFRETCRTEDEWTESDSEDPQSESEKRNDEPELSPPSPPPPITLRRVSGQLIDLATVRLPEGSPERQARMLLAEGATETWEQAQIAVELISRGTEKAAALMAALECTDLAAALTYLNQDCELCASRLPEHEMVSMFRCTHRCCRECARHYFTVQITERSIADCVCPYCKEPELENLPEDAWLDYFAHLDILLKTLLEPELHELFQRKLRDRTLARDPNFKWCVECSSGFFVHPKQKKLRCPECRSVTCSSCRKPWTANHEGLSCEQYAAWLDDNDPERSIAAVQQHLRENGLECPRCRFKYSLSRGGCMHFTCTQCKFEFCYGCGKPFTMGARCGLSDYCAKLGLHAHHPRNCLFYLRDKEPHELQTLLQMNNVTYETEPAEGGSGRCPVQLQRETPTGLVDGVCGSEAPANYAGLCKPHYVEYLAGLARGLDPIPIMDVAELVAELRRRALTLPERGPWDTDPIYAGMCAEIVREKIPLD